MPPDPSDLPPQTTWVRTLAESERSVVGEVLRGDERGVLRLLPAGGPLKTAEFALVGRIEEPGLVLPIDWGLGASGRPWTLRPFVEGRPLDEALQETPERAESWARAILSSLASLHEHGLVHRDVKAANVLVGDDGPRLVDLDLVSVAADGSGAGSPLHLAPEVLLGQPCRPASDLFSVGVMFALALLGRPRESFHQRFPSQSFWDASGLDPAVLEGSLGALIRQLVRRHPSDRPASARDALQRLDGGDAAPPPLGLPFLAGREAARRRLAAGLAPEFGERRVEIMTVDDPEEHDPLLDQLQLALGLAGRSVLCPEIDGPLDALLARLRSEGPASVLLDGAEAVERHGETVLVDLVVSFLDAPGTGTLGIAMAPHPAQRLLATLRRRRLDDVVSRITLASWPRTPVGAVVHHLEELCAGSSPDAARRLAGSLHELAAGRWSDLHRALEEAEAAGVLRADHGAWTILQTQWPAEAVSAGGDSTLSDDEASVLRALAVARVPLELDVAGQLAELDTDRLAAVVGALRRRGILGIDTGHLTLEDRRWATAALQDLDDDALRSWNARCLEVLEPRGVDEDVLVFQRLFAAGDDVERLAVLSGAGTRLLASGRHGTLRRLLGELAATCGDPSPELATPWRLLEARLELAQGDADRAASLLEELDAAGAGDPETWLVAAHVAEQRGRREEARGLNERARAGATSREQLLRANVGLAYADFLDGDAASALARTEDPSPAADETANAAVPWFNLRAVAMTREGRHDEALALLAEALERSRAAEAPLHEARTLLNRAHLDRRDGRPAAAREALGRAAEAFTAAGHVQGRALALNNLGVIHRDRGELTRARHLLTEALTLRRRVGDVHGAASSLGSLAAVELESGQVGIALDTIERARALFSEGEYGAELAFLDVQEALALGLAGRHGEAAARLARAGEVSDHRALAARGEACLAVLVEQRDRAKKLLQAALDRAETADDVAEAFRSAALLLVLRPGDRDLSSRLEDAADRLDSDVRRKEAQWRSRAEGVSLELDVLTDMLETFEQAGRTDLARAVALHLVEAYDGAGDQAGRRGAAARAAEAADALTDGLPGSVRERTLERIARLTGPQPLADRPRGRGISADWLLACNRRMAQEADLEDLLLSIVDLALEVTGSRRGFLVLLEDDEAEVRVARHMDHHALPAEEVRFSRTVLREATRTGEPVVSTDAGADERFAGATSIGSLQLRSILCVPLPGGPDVRGGLYLDNDQRAAAYDERDVERVRGLADQAAVAIANLRRREQIEALNRRLAQRVELQQEELERARKALRQRADVAPLAGLVGESEAMRKMYALVERVAPTDLAVLVTGASGTGKDVVARALHSHSRRADGPLVIENVAAVPATLLESELFGHVRGAFTGADRDRPGLFAEAHGGTFVLDEVGEMPLELQPKLLRVLESGELRPVGSRKTIEIDVRIVACTNRDLLDRVRTGEFREDLYYRINAVELRLPSLDERLEDIPLLVAHFLGQLNARHGTSKAMTDNVLGALVRRPWPGQVRELSNEVARLYFLSDETIDAPELVRPGVASESEGSEPMPASLRLEDIERAAIVRALKATGQRKDRAAEVLGISRAGLYAKLRRLEIDTGSGRGGKSDTSED